ncbi:MAG: ABC transporter permease [Acidobacteria bacterium Pan2503]|uniref:ABC transporter permease n=1 Tax=Candidatus Acidiferrum panamense TaxID=2741543 RepID=A0A7V8NNP6_9BACT|nr:ABC transporter permease [Candidatus Acidoferrum panamensis]
MHSFLQDLRYAARALRNSVGFTLIAVITLGLGMAVNTTVFSLINGMLLRPLPVPHAEQITVLAMRQAGTPDFQKFSYPDFQDIAKQAGAFSDLFAYRETLAGLLVDGKGDHCVLARVTGNYFTALGIKPALGRLILPAEGQIPGADPILVLGYSYWQKRFNGDRSVIGKQVQINGHSATIVGIAPQGFNGTYAILNNDGYIPLSAAFNDKEEAVKDVQELWTHREERSLSVMGRLKPSVSLKQAQASLSLEARRIAEQHPETDKGMSIQAFPERLARPEPDLDNALPAIAVAFTILAALVLLVACFNIANVLLVRAAVRQREMGIRAALGAGRGRLVRQHLTESLLLAFLGGVAGLVLGSWASGYLSSLPLGTDLPISFDFHPDVRVYSFAMAAVVLTGVIVGIIPALRVARNDVNSVLREGSRGSSEGPRRHFVRNTLVVAQLAGSLLLLVVAGLFTRSLGKAQQLDLGFNPDHILNFSVDVQQSGYREMQGRAFYKQLLDRIRALPGVVSAAEAFSVPMGVYSAGDPVIADGHPVEAGKEPPTVMYNAVTPGYFETLQMSLVGGRDFRDSDDAKAPSVAVINQAMAKKFWPDENPIGKRFFTKAVGGNPVEIVGVVRTARYKNIIEDPPLPFFYVPLEQRYLPLRAVHLRTSVSPESLRLPVQSLFREIAPGLAPTQMQTMREALDGVNGLFFFRFAVQLTGTMGLLGLILAVVGVYSVVSYAAAQRIHEIGIRMALGAIPRDILRLVLRQSLLVVAIGLAIGLLASVGATRAIAILFVGIRPTDPITFITMAFLLSFVALFACWIPARRATRVSPLVALRHE